MLDGAFLILLVPCMYRSPNRGVEIWARFIAGFESHFFAVM